MAKISKTWSTRENLWYDEMKSIAPYRERQFEKIILSNLTTLFPDFHAVNYKKTIKADSEENGSKPDFALIRKDYQEWWIVEVETIEDNLKHVSQQISNFTNGDYNAFEQASYIYKLDSNLDFNKLKTMTRENPKILVLVDDINSKWIKELEEYNPSICIFNVFRNNKGFELYSIKGDYPYIFEDQSYCYLDNPYRNLMKLSNPDILQPPMKPQLRRMELFVRKLKFPWLQKKEIETEEIRIVFQGQTTIWKRVEIDDDVYLQSVGTNALRANDTYLLKRTTRYEYIIELN